MKGFLEEYHPKNKDEASKMIACQLDRAELERRTPNLFGTDILNLAAKWDLITDELNDRIHMIEMLCIQKRVKDDLDKAEKRGEMDSTTRTLIASDLQTLRKQGVVSLELEQGFKEVKAYCMVESLKRLIAIASDQIRNKGGEAESGDLDELVDISSRNRNRHLTGQTLKEGLQELAEASGDTILQIHILFDQAKREGVEVPDNIILDFEKVKREDMIASLSEALAKMETNIQRIASIPENEMSPWQRGSSIITSGHDARRIMGDMKERGIELEGELQKRALAAERIFAVDDLQAAIGFSRNSLHNQRGAEVLPFRPHLEGHVPSRHIHPRLADDLERVWGLDIIPDPRLLREINEMLSQADEFPLKN